MKKKGYTLAEALIAMGIIGVVSALMLPMMNKFKPDENKVLFIKTYDAISEVVSDLVSNGTDDDIYPHNVVYKPGPTSSEVTIDFSDAPLMNYSPVYVLSKGEDEKFNNDCEKLCWALQQNMHVLNGSSASCKFTLVNNVEISVGDSDYFTATIDIDGFEKGANNTGSDNADQFEIAILPNGYIAPVSKMAQFYIATRTNWKKIDKDKYEKEKGTVKSYTDEIEYWQEQSKPKCTRNDALLDEDTCTNIIGKLN